MAPRKLRTSQDRKQSIKNRGQAMGKRRLCPTFRIFT